MRSGSARRRQAAGAGIACPSTGTGRVRGAHATGAVARAPLQFARTWRPQREGEPAAPERFNRSFLPLPFPWPRGWVKVVDCRAGRGSCRLVVSRPRPHPLLFHADGSSARIVVLLRHRAAGPLPSHHRPPVRTDAASLARRHVHPASALKGGVHCVISGSLPVQVVVLSRVAHDSTFLASHLPRKDHCVQPCSAPDLVHSAAYVSAPSLGCGVQVEVVTGRHQPAHASMVPKKPPSCSSFSRNTVSVTSQTGQTLALPLETAPHPRNVPQRVRARLDGGAGVGSQRGGWHKRCTRVVV